LKEVDDSEGDEDQSGDDDMVENQGSESELEDDINGKN
jgi:hypothetical protein